MVVSASAGRDGIARTLARCTALLLALGYAAACALVIALGFDHVSDDDFARVTIAQRFANKPSFDPTGTSWLPFPFWALGSVMMIFGRSLALARAASVAMASAAVVLPYLALRGTGRTRAQSALAVVFAVMSPWSIWLGATTVPEAFVASSMAAAAIALGAAASPRARAGFAMAMLAACLSRYDAWPVAAVLAVALAVRAWNAKSSASAMCAVVVAIAPLLWLAWNAHAHGDALHFFMRVSRFKRAIGEGSVDSAEALLLYPRLLVTTRPDVALAVVCATIAAWARVYRDELLQRWRVPLACAAAQIAFLAYGNVRDGAPAHHPERALLGATFILAAFAADVLVAAAALASSRARALVASAVLAAWMLTIVRAVHGVPGSGPAEDRAPQIARGKAFYEEGAGALVVTPCAYEHFALIAGYRAPERVEIRPAAPALAGLANCPAVEPR